MLRLVIAASAVALGVTGALADDTCKARAADKKLAGAALNSFMTRCQKDAASTCDASATSRKLAGAARTSFTKKCVNDAVGT